MYTLPSRFELTNVILTLRNRHLLIIDLIFWAIAPTLALFIRIDKPMELGRYTAALLLFTFLVLAIRPLTFWFMGVYRHYWRYASINELELIALAVFFSSLLLITAHYLTFMAIFLVMGKLPFTTLPRSIPFLEALLTLVVAGGVRLLPRIVQQAQIDQAHTPKQRTLIMGAGDAGTMVAREVRRNPHLGLEAVGFVDDAPDKQNLIIRGLPVLGDRQAIPQLVRQYRVEQLIIAMPQAPGKTIRDVTLLCQQAGVEVRTLPGIYELIDNSVDFNRIRRVRIEDLLRRAPIQTDIRAVHRVLRGRRVLVTGGGGSIGSELCRQILRADPAELILLGHGENSVFEIEQELRTGLARRAKQTPTVVIRSVIADIRFSDRIHSLFAALQPDVIFHAAAHKHVPLMECNPAEAVTNNILGTRNVVQAALAAGVDNLVMISTDKAVNPTNIMGASKRAAELVVLQAACEHQKNYVAVRFGNVLGSRGSVLHTFNRQIANGGPITVTHPDIRRYFMTIPEASQLVLQASVLGKGGEIFTLDMGEPIRIVDIAQDMVRLSGLELGSDIDIEYVGLRPGEKLFEELFLAEETYVNTAHGQIFVSPNAYDLAPDALEAYIQQVALAANADDRDQIVKGLKQLVSEYRPTDDALDENVKTVADDTLKTPRSSLPYAPTGVHSYSPAA